MELLAELNTLIAKDVRGKGGGGIDEIEKQNYTATFYDSFTVWRVLYIQFQCFTKVANSRG